MSTEYLSIEVKGSKKGTKVSGTGRTPRGTKYIKAEIQIEAKSPADPNYRKQIAQAVADLTL